MSKTSIHGKVDISKTKAKGNLEQELDQKIVNDYYTLVLRKAVHTTDPDALKTYAEDKKVRMKIIDWRHGQLLTVIDRKNRILGQLPIKYFIKA